MLAKQGRVNPALEHAAMRSAINATLREWYPTLQNTVGRFVVTDADVDFAVWVLANGNRCPLREVRGRAPCLTGSGLFAHEGAPFPPYKKGQVEAYAKASLQGHAAGVERIGCLNGAVVVRFMAAVEA